MAINSFNFKGFMKSILFLLFFPLLVNADVIYPEDSKPDPAIVMLVGGMSICTGSVVGLNPVTVITAKHCPAAGVGYLDQTLPSKVLTKKYQDKLFSVEDGILPGDVAVLVFKEPVEHFQSLSGITKDDLFRLNTAPIMGGQKIEFCGYGGHLPQMNDYTTGEFHCGSNSLIIEASELNWSKDYPTDAGDKFSTYEEKDQKKILMSMVQEGLVEFGSGTRIGITNLPGPKKQSLLQTGDSGGPMFMRDQDGRKTLIAVSSAGGAVEIEGAFRPILGFGWRIDSPWTKEFLQETRDNGADL